MLPVVEENKQLVAEARRELERMRKATALLAETISTTIAVRASRGHVDESPPLACEELVAHSVAMKGVVELTSRVARLDATLLITGEHGAGKERMARRIHADSSRGSGSFTVVHCGLAAEGALERELFGEGGTAGALEAANATVFLDEIGETPLTLQARLVHALQARVVPARGRDEGSGRASARDRDCIE